MTFKWKQLKKLLLRGKKPLNDNENIVQTTDTNELIKRWEYTKQTSNTVRKYLIELIEPFTKNLQREDFIRKLCQATEKLHCDVMDDDRELETNGYVSFDTQTETGKTTTLICLPCPGEKYENVDAQLTNQSSVVHGHYFRPRKGDQIILNDSRYFQNGSNRMRHVTSPCVICIDIFDEGDDVCWSSNKNCAHVFHTNCLLSWYTRLSRTRSWRNNVNDIRAVGLLDIIFPLECPICRLDFLHVHHNDCAVKSYS